MVYEDRPRHTLWRTTSGAVRVEARAVGRGSVCGSPEQEGRLLGRDRPPYLPGGWRWALSARPSRTGAGTEARREGRPRAELCSQKPAVALALRHSALTAFDLSCPGMRPRGSLWHTLGREEAGNCLAVPTYPWHPVEHRRCRLRVDTGVLRGSGCSWSEVTPRCFQTGPNGLPTRGCSFRRWAAGSPSARAVTARQQGASCEPLPGQS